MGTAAEECRDRRPLLSAQITHRAISESRRPGLRIAKQPHKPRFWGTFPHAALPALGRAHLRKGRAN